MEMKEKLLNKDKRKSYQTLEKDGVKNGKNNYLFDTDVNPEDNASIFSRLFFCWLIPIIRLVKSHRYLSVSEFFPVKRNLASESLYECFKRKWDVSQENGILMTLFNIMSFKLIIIFIASHVLVCLFIGQTLLAAYLVNHFERSAQSSKTEAYISGVGLTLCTALYGIANPTLQYQGLKIGMRIRVILGAGVFNKIVKMSNKDLQLYGSGEIITLLSTDLELLVEATRHMHASFAFPFVSAVSIWLIYRDIGLACLPGIIFNIVSVLLFILVQPVTSIIRGMVARRSSKRIELMKDIIRSIEVVKIYCWENLFSKLLSIERQKEIKKIGLMYAWCIFVQAFFLINIILSQFLSITTYYYYGGVINSMLLVRVMGVMYLFAMQARYAAYCANQFGQAYKSIKRIENFLKVKATRRVSDECKSLNYISCKNMSAFWGSQNSISCIRNISFEVKPGSLMVVIGPTGAGKSSLLMSILGNLRVTNGSCLAPQHMSYAPQEPWIFSDTIKENILFGSTLNTEFYNQVISSCGLVQDFASFPYGDETLIGERGLTLSGGQKARVALARAVYKNLDVILLDDPLSAVDQTVGQHIFDECIQGLLSNKTRILVTHHWKYVKYADLVLVLEKGQMMHCGNFLQNKDILDSYSTTSEKEVTDNKHYQDANLKTTKDHRHLYIDEQEQGEVSWWVYNKFLKAGKGILTLVPAILLSAAGQAGLKYGEWFIADRTEQSHYNGSLRAESTSDIAPYIEVVVAFVVSTPFVCILTSLFILIAARNLHNNMFKFVLGAKMIFFQRPLGSILNRFARDLGMVDTLMLNSLIPILSHGIAALSIFVFSAYVTPWLLFSLLPFILAVVIVSRYGLGSGREFRRMEAVCRSPLYTHVSNTLSGHVSIQAMNKEKHMMDVFHKHQDLHTSAYSLYLSSFIWMNLNVTILCVGYYVTVVISSLFLDQGGKGAISALIIVMLGQAIDVIQALNFRLIEFNLMMTSIERILAYSYLEQEETLVLNPSTQNKWPSEGKITFENISLQYNRSDMWALKNLSFTIDGSEKVGIIGRTGAGKSSIFKAIMRLVDYEGVISIDGVDISGMSLETLRKSISVIPQESIIFNGSLRKNLDPFGSINDDGLWAALDNVQLGEYVRNLPAQLDEQIGNGELDLSVGQKQLLALARALIKKNKIIIMDEATANVDMSTDKLIMKTIQSQFHDCTVLTIAHRIDTVKNYDKIMVISEGSIVKFAEPHNIKEMDT